MINLSSLRGQIERLRILAESESPRRKPTTSEIRNELERVLAEIESRPADAPPHPDVTGLREAQQELARVLVVLNRLYPQEASA